MATLLPSDLHERPYWDRSLSVAGIDEAGRGALAGPVVAALVILDPAAVPDGLRDSKTLSAAQREALEPLIKRAARAWSVSVVGQQRIDEVNILQATFDAMHEAVATSPVRPDHLLIDGNRFRAHAIPHTTIVHGDAVSVSIAAASILAKVARDRTMCSLDEQFPVYGFAVHKGYGTALHRAKIIEHGPSSVHRRTFLHKVLACI